MNHEKSIFYNNGLPLDVYYGCEWTEKAGSRSHFEKNYAEALAKVGKSKQKQGLVFVYCYQEGNSACAKMGNLVLKSRQVGDFINQHFVSTRIDVGQAGNEDL